jgi:WD40 repeat protein/DNA-binding SARP family transcriptional activator
MLQPGSSVEVRDDGGAAMAEFQALGGVGVTRDGSEVGVGGPRQRRLLALLLIHRNAVVSADRLVDAVFAGDPTPAAGTTLRSYVARMRRVMGEDGAGVALVTQAPGYLLRVPDEAFDVACFEAGLAEGRSLLSRDDPAGAATVLRAALTLWRGDAYAEFDDEDWARPEAQRLAELRLVAHELCFEAELADGRAAQIVAELEAMAGQHPLREAFVAQLMLARYRSGRQADALRAYRAHREVLVDELGLDPTPTLQELEERILAHDPDLLAGEPGGGVLRGYRLGDRLGTGQDGTVHAAHLPGVDRDLVIRLVRPELADAPDFVRSFEATAQRLASLRHPAIVPIHDYWREPGSAYLVMRRMHGGSLADRLERADRRVLTEAEVSVIVQRIGAALVTAAEAGVVHGRISPRSVLFDEAGEAWLTDFDLGTPAADQSPDRDVAALADLVGACLPDPPPAVAAALDGGRSATARPPIAEYVPLLVAALRGGRVAGAAPAPNPYKGLRAFDEADAADFFGRDALVDELIDRLGHDDARGRLVLVVGGSGTGKSSVVRAGLLPRVRRGEVPGSGQWFVTTMLPGAAPFKELAAALRRVAVTEADGVADALAADHGIDTVIRRLLPPGGELLLVVDQLEELFTSAPERDQRRFLDGLVHAATAEDSRLRVVGTLRADFYDRPLAVQPFGAMVNDATVTIPAMSAAELETAIVEPANRADRHVDGALVAELVAAALDEPAGLPALQFTLFELAERTGGDLTLTEYREIGGLSGAIASRAESLYRALEDDDRSAVRRLFGQLVVVHADGEPTRRRALRVDLAAGDTDVDTLIERWADARLLSLDRHRQSRLPTVEPAHEALLREWPRLRRWIDEDRGALLLLGHLRDAAASWVELDHDPGALYRGTRLQVALDTLGATALGPQERAFLDDSRAAHEAEEHEAAARVERQARTNRRLRRQLVVTGVALVIALVGGFVAIDQRSDAVQERRLAFARELAAASDASIDEDPERALLLALEAVETSRDGDGALPEAIGALHLAISRSRVVLSVPDVGGNLDWSPDGSVFVTEGPEDSGLVDIRDATTGESVRSWVGHEIDINEVAFDATGEVVATGGDDGYLRLWDTATGEELGAYSPDPGGSVWGPSFSPDGALVAAGWIHPEGMRMRVIDRSSGEVLSELERRTVMGTDFSPDSTRVAVASIEEPGVVVVDARSGAEVLHLGADLEPAGDARFSPDGRWLASGHINGAVRIWDATTGEQRFLVAGHTSDASALDWSPDSSRLATAGGGDGTARVHEITEGGVRELVAVSAQDTANGMAAVAFSPDGEGIMTSDWAIVSTKVWDVSERAGAEWANLPSAATRLGDGAFLPDGRTLVGIDPDGGVARWDVETGERAAGLDLVVPEYALWEGATSLAPSPDGKLVASITERGLSLHDLATGREVAPLPTVEGFVTDLEWTRDGTHLAYSQFRDEDGRGMVTVVDRAGDQLAELVEEDDFTIRRVTFTADGSRLVAARSTWRQAPGIVGLRVWDWRGGTPVLDIEELALDVTAAPTGDRIAFAKELTGEAEIWDLGSGRRLRTMRGGGGAYGITWSADGERIALAGADGTVRVFDADEGRLELILRGHERAVGSAAFSPDGTRLASLDEGGMVRVWALGLDELIGIARSRLTRTLDDEECRQYLRDERCGQG